MVDETILLIKGDVRRRPLNRFKTLFIHIISEAFVYSCSLAKIVVLLEKVHHTCFQKGWCYFHLHENYEKNSVWLYVIPK